MPFTPMPNTMQSLAGWLANSPVMRRGRRLMAENEKNWNLPLSKFDKLLTGSYLIMAHYSLGRFPPRFEDRNAAYEAERQYLNSLPGVAPKVAQESSIRKPFWNARIFSKYSQDFGRLLLILESLRLPPGSRLMELGCGPGWMATFLATTGYNVLGTTIGGPDEEILARREKAFEALGLDSSLRHEVAPMEKVDQLAGCLEAFDGVFVYEALHHAFAWREAIQASYRCLRPGGWLILASEPNVLHTAISYRAAHLSRTHEIGFSRAQLVGGLTEAGFDTIRFFAPKWNNLVAHFWLAAQRPSASAGHPLA